MNSNTYKVQTSRNTSSSIAIKQVTNEATMLTPFDTTAQNDDYAPQTIADYSAPEKATRQLRILVIATEAPPVRGGIARVVGYLRDGFEARGHHVDILAYPLVGRINFGEVRLSSLALKLPELFRSFKEYDVIHVHGATPTISDVMLLFTRLYKVRPVIIYTHHMDLDFGPVKFFSKVYNFMHRQCAAQADAVIAGTWDNLPSHTDRSSVIPFGIDLARFQERAAKDEQFTVLFTGQFRPYKGIRVLLKAMSLLSGVRLLIAGHGPEEQIYRSLAEELNVDVEFHVGLNDAQVRKLYQRAHVIVLPSISRLEAFGLTLVEGMATGCIPVASDLPGVRDVVGKTGFTFPVGDVERLAQIFSSLRDDRAQVERMSANAYIRATEFDQDRTVYEYERLIAGLVTCNTLKNRLADTTRSVASTLHTFVTNIAQDLAADEVAIVMNTAHDELSPIAATHATLAPGCPELQQVTDLLGAHAINTGKSTMIGLNDGHLRLRHEASSEMSAVMVTPLTKNGKRFGAVIAMRNKPFSQNDLDNLTRFAHSIAPSLQALGQAAPSMQTLGQVTPLTIELQQVEVC